MGNATWEVVFFVFAAVAAIQLFYYLFFFARLSFYKRRQQSASGRVSVPVSVIICAKNEEYNLMKNLPTVLQQRYHKDDHTPHYEVVVVNDNSTDDTKYYLRSIEPGYPHYRHIELKQEAKLIPGKKYPLSIGIKGAAHAHLLLTDADCRPASTHWLQLMSEGFAEGKEIVLGYGPYCKKPGFLNKLIRYETYFAALQYLSYALAGIPYMGVGRNLAYKKELFFQHKGFLSHQHIASGDDDLFINTAANAQNTTIMIEKDAFTYSEPKTRWQDWYQQKKRHLSTGRHYKPLHQFLLGLFSGAHLLFYPAFILALLYPPFFYITLGIGGLQLLVQGIIHHRAMRQLNEKDLFLYSWLMDILMCLYYLIFIPALLFAPSNKWKSS